MFLWIRVSATLSLHKTGHGLAHQGRLDGDGPFLLIAELPYDLFLHLTLVRSLWIYVNHSENCWR